MLTLYDICNADECLVTGTAAEVTPAVKVDGRPIGTGRPNPLTMRLIAEFRALVADEAGPISR